MTKDLLPLKVVIEELGVSRATLWRIRQSGIAEMPAAVVRSRMLFWRRIDLPKLEDACLRYQGRISFERNRAAAERIRVLRIALNARLSSRCRRARDQPGDVDLFAWGTGPGA